MLFFLFRYLWIDFAIQWFAFGVAVYKKTSTFYDFIGSSTFFLLTVMGFLDSQQNLRQNLLCCMVLAWSLRLGSYLVTRAVKSGEDRRFKRALTKPAIFFLFWSIQGVWIIVTLLPVVIVFETNSVDISLNWFDWMSCFVWLTGFLCESIADYQKSKFRDDEDNKDKFITTGLWAWSRHPNYFGEIVCWVGVFGVAFRALFAAGYFYALLGMCSPMFTYFLLRHISGVPLLEAQNFKKWGDKVDFLEYVGRTNLLLPLPKRRRTRFSKHA